LCTHLVCTGEILAIVGPSGADQSSLLDILTTCTAPTLRRLLLNSMPLQLSSFRGSWRTAPRWTSRSTCSSSLRPSCSWRHCCTRSRLTEERP
jgi:ABC-type glutathione transport system ATPase component